METYSRAQRQGMSHNRPEVRTPSPPVVIAFLFASAVMEVKSKMDD